MLKILSSILSIFAPWARAETVVSSATIGHSYDELISLLSKSFIKKKADGKLVKFRVKGDFFANLDSTQVVIGKSADPSHYVNIGFNLLVSDLENEQISMVAEERVIFGYLEVNAVGKALNQRLEQLVHKINANKT